MMLGGDKLPYKLDVGSPEESMLEKNIIATSIISDVEKGAHFLSYDLKYFLLATPIQRPEYMKIAWTYIPSDIITKYKLQDIHSPDGIIYYKIQKGMYGIKQAAVLT